ncbi:MGMT family protein [Puia sp. P3]|uniref:MGMT family protein n=1 Tax=Puia sp. P3 TaxID=3423952 RepID=UPI003D66D530
MKPSGAKEESLADLIFDVVRQIPKGRVSTYGAIAAVLDLPNPRMVGRAMRSVDDKGRKVPAQRVINSAGRITGDHPESRRALLEKKASK